MAYTNQVACLALIKGLGFIVQLRTYYFKGLGFAYIHACVVCTSLKLLSFCKSVFCRAILLM